MYEFAPEDLIQRLLYFNPEVWPALQASMERYPCRGPEPEILSDVSDGAFCREHKYLGVDADDDGSFRLAFGLYNDGIEMVNPLGSFIGRHHVDIYYLQILGLPPDKRQVFDNILLVSVVLSDHVKLYGHEQAMSGIVRNQGKLVFDLGSKGHSCLSSFRRMHDGIPMHVPNGKEHMEVMFRAWLILVSSDYLAAAGLQGTMGGATAHVFCRCCDANQSAACSETYPSPCSFLDENSDLPQPFALIDTATRESDRADVGHGRASLARVGMTHWNSVLKLFPGLELSYPEVTPNDIQHDMGTGQAKHEIAFMLYVFIKRRTWFSLEEVNLAIRYVSSVHNVPRARA